MAAVSIHAAETIIRIDKVIPFSEQWPCHGILRTAARFTFQWHMNCDQNSMAKKMNMLQVAQAAQRELQVVKRQSATPAPALYLMQLRTQLNKVTAHRRRLQIAVQADAQELVPESVKIIHAG
jgi:hypothetical protein